MNYIKRKSYLIVVLILLIVINLNIVIGKAMEDEKKDAQEEIEKVLHQQVAAWNRGDLEGFMAGYWQSSDLSFYSGKSITKGWQPTLDRYRQRYQAEGREMGKLTFSDLKIEMLGSDSAFVRGKWQLEMNKETAGGLFTLIFKRFPDGWHIIHDHTSV